MRNHAVKILLLIMMLSGIMMPVHAYAHELEKNPEHQNIGIDTYHDIDKDLACDHCCHFVSHSLGLLQKKICLITPVIREVIAFQAQNYTSIKGPPPYQPPIV